MGNYSIRYSVHNGKDKILEIVRQVVIEPVNPCLAPEGSPCRHKCHAFTTCVFTDPGYTCECRSGFAKVVDEATGELFCRDNEPPAITLLGLEHVMLNACRVCQWYDPGEHYSEDKHGGYVAFDILPDGRKVDLTDKVVRTEQQLGDGEWEIHYNVNDSAGNPAPTRIRRVTKRTEDVLRRIETVEAFLEKRFRDFEPAHRTFNALHYYGLPILQGLALIIGLLFLWYMIPRLYNLFKVMLLNSEPNFTEYADAYDLYYAFSRPWWNASYRARMIQMEYQQTKYDENRG